MTSNLAKKWHILAKRTVLKNRSYQRTFYYLVKNSEIYSVHDYLGLTYCSNICISEFHEINGFIEARIKLKIQFKLNGKFHFHTAMVTISRSYISLEHPNLGMSNSINKVRMKSKVDFLYWKIFLNIFQVRGVKISRRKKTFFFNSNN